MFGTIVGELAERQIQLKQSVEFCNSVAQFNLLTDPSNKALDLMKRKLESTKAKLHIAPDHEERAWAVWGNLKSASKF